MYSTTIILGLTSATLAVAQSTVSLFLLGTNDTTPFLASIVGSDATATTYAIQCAGPATECDGFPVITLTEGPTRAAFTIPPSVNEDGTTDTLPVGGADCALATSSAVCTISFVGDNTTTLETSSTTLSGTDYVFLPVTLTNSLPPLTGVSGTATTTIISTSSRATGTITSTTSTSASGSKTSNSQTSSSQTSSGPAAQNTSSSKTGTSSSAAGAAAITGQAALLMGGAALAMAAMV